MSISRNDPCPCGSGKKYKKCCLSVTSADSPSQKVTGRFRFEHGAYGGLGLGFAPSVLCYEQTAPGHWSEHFCLANPTCAVNTEDEASSIAQKDLSEAFAIKYKSGSDAEFALFLRGKGYVNVDGFQRAKD